MNAYGVLVQQNWLQCYICVKAKLDDQKSTQQLPALCDPGPSTDQRTSHTATLYHATSSSLGGERVRSEAAAAKHHQSDRGQEADLCEAVGLLSGCTAWCTDWRVRLLRTGMRAIVSCSKCLGCPARTMRNTAGSVSGARSCSVCARRPANAVAPNTCR